MKWGDFDMCVKSCAVPFTYVARDNSLISLESTTLAEITSNRTKAELYAYLWTTPLPSHHFLWGKGDGTEGLPDVVGFKTRQQSASTSLRQ